SSYTPVFMSPAPFIHLRTLHPSSYDPVILTPPSAPKKPILRCFRHPTHLSSSHPLPSSIYVLYIPLPMIPSSSHRQPLRKDPSLHASVILHTCLQVTRSPHPSTYSTSIFL